MADTRVRQAAQVKRVFEALPVCPAGAQIAERIDGSGCFCRIVHEPIAAATSPHTLRQFCFGDYQACPTWKADRDAYLEERSKRFEREMAVG